MGAIVKLTRVLVMVMVWMFGSDGCHVTSKGEELSYKLGYLITAALFFTISTVCTDCQGLSATTAKVYLHWPHYKICSS